jgi:hypothetical protein
MGFFTLYFRRIKLKEHSVVSIYRVLLSQYSIILLVSGKLLVTWASASNPESVGGAEAAVRIGMFP